MPIALWSKQAVIAVGHATQQALQARGVSALVPHNHDSEGLLALAPLQHVQQQDVLIIRGDGGRERLANDLRQRGASVHYFESYQRVWRRHSLALVKTWQQQQINCILITSNALLEFIVNLINNADNYWREECLWIVASQRIASNAENLGIKRVINANGASQQALLLALSAQ